MLIIITSCSKTITVGETKCEGRINPSGVSKTPSFNWITESKERDQLQTAYQIIITDKLTLAMKKKGTTWNSGKVVSEQSLHVTYSGDLLEPGKQYYWRVKVWNQEGKSAWSKINKFITALFDSSDWHGAKWIGYEELPDSLYLVPGVHPWKKDVSQLAQNRPVIPYFRKEFKVDKEIESACLFISGLGHYKAYINGKHVSEDVLSPGWTDYEKYCLYNVYDVGRYIESEKNAIGVMVGNGFHNINNERYKKLLITYGNPKLIALLKITYTDGTEKTIITNETWKTAPSPITYSCIYSGENYNANLEQLGWNKSGFDDSSWKNVLLVKPPKGKLEPEITYPVKVYLNIEEDTIHQLATDTFVYDFGQNAAGILRLKIKGKKGQTIRLWPGELLFDDKHVNQNATGSPYFWEYTIKGEGEEFYQPFFTYYGFRYVQIENAVPKGFHNENNVPEIIEIELLHTYSVVPRIGIFYCSNTLFNEINFLILYAIQSNMQSIITDCPHREKLGWLEQTYLMGGSMHYNYDIYNLYKKTVKDISYAQKENGLIPSIAPEYVYFGHGFTDSPEWGSAGIILPWLIYKWYGDKDIIQEAWPTMKKYIEYLGTKAKDYILSYGLGDWYDLGPERPGMAQHTPKGVTATGIYYYDAILMNKMARLMGLEKDADKYKMLAKDIKQAFNQKYYNDTKKIYATGSQTAMAMPLCLGLVPQNDYNMVLQNLIDSINANNKALTAGDIGFHFLIEALTNGGASQLIYEMNNRDDVPGYGYQLKNGATALTESWQALPDVSNNHMMLGHVMEWFYKGLGGIQQSESSIAYKEIVIKPNLINDLDTLICYFDSPYGRIYSGWINNSNRCNQTIFIPVNTQATVYLLSSDIHKITESGSAISEIENIEILGKEGDNILVKVGSGNYSFVISKE